MTDKPPIKTYLMYTNKTKILLMLADLHDQITLRLINNIHHRGIMR